jgi:GNAT superfamily N-acetyltransferase
VPGGDGRYCWSRPLAHVDAVGDAVAVGDDQRGPVVGLRLAERLQRLLGVGAHRHPGHVHVAVRDGLQGQVLLARLLARRGELGDGADRRGLRGLAAGVGVHLGVEHQHVDVAARGEHVVEAAGADVVGPAVAADDPHRLRRIRWSATAAQVLHSGPVIPSSGQQLGDPRALRGELSTRAPAGLEDAVDQVGAELIPRAGPSRARASSAAGRRPAAARARTRRCPRTASCDHAGPRPSAFGRPRRRRQVAAVDRRAAGGVRDHQSRSPKSWVSSLR